MDRSLLVRTVATGAATVVFTGLFAVGVAGFLHPWLPAPVAVHPVALAVPLTVALLAWQTRTVHRNLVDSLDARFAGDDAYPGLKARLDRLAQSLDTTQPRLAVVDSDTPNSCSVADGRTGTIAVSTGLLDACDDAELDAVLAHELAHLHNRDAVVLTAAAFLPAVVNGETPLDRRSGNATAATRWLLLGLAVPVLYVLAVPSLPGAAFSGQSLLAFLTAGVGVVVVGGVALGALATPVVFLARSLSRTREFAADRAAARLTGDPATLATVLERFGDVDRPDADLRRAEDSLYGLCLLPGGFEPSTEPDGFRVETQAHPAVDERIRRLRDVATELETG